MQADQQLDQAKALDVPDEMQPAQESLLIALEWRRDGLDYIAERIRTALGDSGDAADEAIQQIAGQMEVFLASDVAYETRVVPFIKHGARRERDRRAGDRAARVPARRSTGCSPRPWPRKLGQQLSAGAGRDEDEPTGPGLHGTNIDSTSYGDTTLQPDAPNQLTYNADSTFAVKFTNGGENDEFDVKVTVKHPGPRAGTPITLSDTIDQIAPQASATAELALEDPPPLGSRGDDPRRVARCRARRRLDNNEAEYQAIFNEG